MTTTITAAVAREQGKPLVVEHLELDEIRPNEARSDSLPAGSAIRMRSSATACTPPLCRPFSGTRAPAWSRLSARPSKR
jgi:hypothetical protein